jgi:hypothetical protein
LTVAAGGRYFPVMNRPFYGDNLDVLRRKIASGSVDLCYIDPMRDEIAAAGKYKHPLLEREDDRLQVVTVAELLAPHNKRLDLPMARADAVKSAAALGDAGRQVALDL